MTIRKRGRRSGIYDRNRVEHRDLTLALDRARAERAAKRRDPAARSSRNIPRCALCDDVKAYRARSLKSPLCYWCLCRLGWPKPEEQERVARKALEARQAAEPESPWPQDWQA